MEVKDRYRQRLNHTSNLADVAHAASARDEGNLEVKDRYRQRLNHTSNLADATQPRPETRGIWRLKTGIDRG